MKPTRVGGARVVNSSNLTPKHTWAGPCTANLHQACLLPLPAARPRSARSKWHTLCLMGTHPCSASQHATSTQYAQRCTGCAVARCSACRTACIARRLAGFWSWCATISLVPGPFETACMKVLILPFCQEKVNAMTPPSWSSLHLPLVIPDDCLHCQTCISMASARCLGPPPKTGQSWTKTSKERMSHYLIGGL